MAMDAAEIERLIKAALPDAQVTIEDLRGDGDHYAAHVVSGAFRGKSRVQQHQIVYQALAAVWAASCTPWRCRRAPPRTDFTNRPRSAAARAACPATRTERWTPPHKTASANR